MKIKFFLLLLSLGLTINVNSQDEAKRIEVIGFACNFAGAPTEPVKKALKMLIDRDYESIKKLLYSSSSADQFMAVISMEYLNKTNALSISQFEKEII